MIYRRELPGDEEGIRTVLCSAFGREDEARLVDALRSGGGLTLSFVAVEVDLVVGHIGFSKLAIGQEPPSSSVLALAPVAVQAGRQRAGTGSGLIRWGLEQSRHRQCKAVIVLGEPAYYTRFGFVPASLYGISCPFPVPDEAFMALELVPDALKNRRGTVTYREEFNAVT